MAEICDSQQLDPQQDLDELASESKESQRKAVLESKTLELSDHYGKLYCTYCTGY